MTSIPLLEEDLEKSYFRNYRVQANNDSNIDVNNEDDTRELNNLSEEVKGTHIARTLSVTSVAFICWLNVSGGPIGTEQIISECGPAFGFIGLLVFPCLWSFPQALITAEMSTLFPGNGGYSLWVLSLFGKFWGIQESWWSWCSGVIDNAIYPVLFYNTAIEIFDGNYASNVDSSGDDDDVVNSGVFGCLSLSGNEKSHCLNAWLIKAVVAILFTLPNLLRVEHVGNGLTVIGLLILFPFLVMSILAVPNLHPSRWIEYRGECVGHWSPYDENDFTNSTVTLNNTNVYPYPHPHHHHHHNHFGWKRLGNLLQVLYWNLSGWQCVSTCAGEVKRPSYTMPRALFVALCITLASYFLPLLAASGSTKTDWRHWDDGSLSHIAKQIAHAIGLSNGKWMGLWIVGASALSNWGQFGSELLEDSYQLLGMAE
eukprot:g1579.t1